MILVNNPGSWIHIYDPLEHAKWHGLTPTDLVFPFFLFAVGNALAFVMPKMEARGDGYFWRKVLLRSAIIFAIGLFLNWWPFFRWQDGSLQFIEWVSSDDPTRGVRIFGVLQRIAVCYLVAAILVYYLKARKAFYVGLLLLLIYWALCYVINPSDPYSLQGWFGTNVDIKVLGTAHLYRGEGVPFDPEGLMSTIPAIVQVIFGFIVGDHIRSYAKDMNVGENAYRLLTGLFIGAVAMLLAGYVWSWVFPINKKIWTSSYTLFTSGLATVTIATMIYMIEMKNKRGWLSRFFDVFGKNALFVFALSAFLPKGLALVRIPYTNSKGEEAYTNPWRWMYDEVFVHVPGAPENGSLLFALFIITFMWLICFVLDRKKIYIKV